jgi:hypothetical protein
MSPAEKNLRGEFPCPVISGNNSHAANSAHVEYVGVCHATNSMLHKYFSIHQAANYVLFRVLH